MMRLGWRASRRPGHSKAACAIVSASPRQRSTTTAFRSVCIEGSPKVALGPLEDMAVAAGWVPVSRPAGAGLDESTKHWHESRKRSRSSTSTTNPLSDSLSSRAKLPAGTAVANRTQVPIPVFPYTSCRDAVGIYLLWRPAQGRAKEASCTK